MEQQQHTTNSGYWTTNTTNTTWSAGGHSLASAPSNINSLRYDHYQHVQPSVGQQYDAGAAGGVNYTRQPAVTTVRRLDDRYAGNGQTVQQTRSVVQQPNNPATTNYSPLGAAGNYNASGPPPLNLSRQRSSHSSEPSGQLQRAQHRTHSTNQHHISPHAGQMTVSGHPPSYAATSNFATGSTVPPWNAVLEQPVHNNAGYHHHQMTQTSSSYRVQQQSNNASPYSHAISHGGSGYDVGAVPSATYTRPSCLATVNREPLTQSTGQIQQELSRNHSASTRMDSIQRTEVRNGSGSAMPAHLPSGRPLLVSDLPAGAPTREESSTFPAHYSQRAAYPNAPQPNGGLVDSVRSAQPSNPYQQHQGERWHGAMLASDDGYSNRASSGGGGGGNGGNALLKPYVEQRQNVNLRLNHQAAVASPQNRSQPPPPLPYGNQVPANYSMMSDAVGHVGQTPRGGAPMDSVPTYVQRPPGNYYKCPWAGCGNQSITSVDELIGHLLRTHAINNDSARTVVNYIHQSLLFHYSKNDKIPQIPSTSHGHCAPLPSTSLYSPYGPVSSPQLSWPASASGAPPVCPAPPPAPAATNRASRPRGRPRKATTVGLPYMLPTPPTPKAAPVPPVIRHEPTISPALSSSSHPRKATTVVLPYILPRPPTPTPIAAPTLSQLLSTPNLVAALSRSPLFDPIQHLSNMCTTSHNQIMQNGFQPVPIAVSQSVTTTQQVQPAGTYGLILMTPVVANSGVASLQQPVLPDPSPVIVQPLMRNPTPTNLQPVVQDRNPVLVRETTPASQQLSHESIAINASGDDTGPMAAHHPPVVSEHTLGVSPLMPRVSDPDPTSCHQPISPDQSPDIDQSFISNPGPDTIDDLDSVGVSSLAALQLSQKSNANSVTALLDDAELMAADDLLADEAVLSSQVSLEKLQEISIVESSSSEMPALDSAGALLEMMACMSAEQMEATILRQLQSSKMGLEVPKLDIPRCSTPLLQQEVKMEDQSELSTTTNHKLGNGWQPVSTSSTSFDDLSDDDLSDDDVLIVAEISSSSSSGTSMATSSLDRRPRRDSLSAASPAATTTTALNTVDPPTPTLPVPEEREKNAASPAVAEQSSEVKTDSRKRKKWSMADHQKLLSEISAMRNYYRTTLVKPPYPLRTLIRQAIVESAERQLTWVGIRLWLVTNYKYYGQLCSAEWTSKRHQFYKFKCFNSVRSTTDPRSCTFTVDDEIYFDTSCVLPTKRARVATPDLYDDESTVPFVVPELTPAMTPANSPATDQLQEQTISSSSPSPGVLDRLEEQHNLFSKVSEKRVPFSQLYDFTEDFNKNKLLYRLAEVEPPYPLCAIIRTAIQLTPDQELTFGELYNWAMRSIQCFGNHKVEIEELFRHILDVSPAFYREPNNDGGSWRVNEEEYDLIRKEDAVFFKSIEDPVPNSPKRKKRVPSKKSSEMTVAAAPAAAAAAAPAPAPAPPLPLHSTRSEVEQKFDRSLQKFLKDVRSPTKDKLAKPKYTMAYIIMMCMVHHKDRCLRESEICDWLTETFAYYKERREPLMAKVSRELLRQEHFVSDDAGATWDFDCHRYLDKRNRDKSK